MNYESRGGLQFIEDEAAAAQNPAITKVARSSTSNRREPSANAGEPAKSRATV